MPQKVTYNNSNAEAVESLAKISQSEEFEEVVLRRLTLKDAQKEATKEKKSFFSGFRYCCWR